MEYYIAGEKTSCTKAIAMKYEVSEQTARKYKRQFEDFVKKYFSKVFRFWHSVSELIVRGIF